MYFALNCPASTCEVYTDSTNSSSYYLTTPKGTLEIESKWQDAGGNIWYRFHVIDMPGGEKFQTLYKFSKSGTVLERVYIEVAEFDPKNVPTSTDPKNGSYGIWFRSADQK